MSFLKHKVIATLILTTGFFSVLFLFSPTGLASMVRVIQIVIGPAPLLWTQTDWVGGSGQQIWLDPTKYDSDNGNIDTRATGETTLGPTTVTPWVPAGGDVMNDTTDTDFDQGQFAGTVRIGSSSPASVILGQGTVWGAHPSSGTATTQIIRAVEVISSSDIWAVGDSGKILHYNGTTWTEFADVGAVNLYAVSAVSASNIWAVGTSGKIYHYNGTTWTEFADKGSITLRSIRMLSVGDGWLTGTSGKIYRWNGTTWNEFTDTGNQTWASLHMLSSINGWVAGSSGQIYRWNGTTWALQSDTGNQTWNALAFVSATDGWMAGSGGEIYRWNGSTWTFYTNTGRQTWNALHMFSATDGWLAGTSGEIYRWNGSTWSLHTDTGAQIWNALAFVSATDGWAVGDGGSIFSYSNAYLPSGSFQSRIFDGTTATTSWSSLFWTEILPVGSSITIATRTGNTPIPDGTWSAFSAELSQPESSTVTSPSARYFQYRATITRGANTAETPEFQDISIVLNSPLAVTFFGADAVSASDIRAVGGSGKIYHYDGTTWAEEADMGTLTIFSISSVSASDIWAVGDSGKIYHRTGGVWSEFMDTGAQTWTSIHMLSAVDGWVAGSGGEIYRWNGVSWSLHTDTGAQIWNALAFVSATDGWAVGDGGEIERWNGTSWSLFSDVGNIDLRGVVMVSSSDGWIVGASGKIYRYNGTSWAQFIDTGNDTWNAVTMSSGSDGWVVGSGGNILLWNGTSWAIVASNTTVDLFSTISLGKLNAWIFGTLDAFHLFITGGFLTSSAFDMTNASPLTLVSWTESVPVCAPACDILLQVRTATDGGGAPGVWTDWHGAGGAGTYFTNPAGATTPAGLNGNRFMQYRAHFFGDGSSTPTLFDVKVDYQ